jgi:hypothetical protein
MARYFEEPQCMAICPMPKTCMIDSDVPRYAAAD